MNHLIRMRPEYRLSRIYFHVGLPAIFFAFCYCCPVCNAGVLTATVVNAEPGVTGGFGVNPVLPPKTDEEILGDGLDDDAYAYAALTRIPSGGRIGRNSVSVLAFSSIVPLTISDQEVNGDPAIIVDASGRTHLRMGYRVRGEPGAGYTASTSFEDSIFGTPGEVITLRLFHSVAGFDISYTTFGFGPRLAVYDLDSDLEIPTIGGWDEVLVNNFDPVSRNLRFEAIWEQDVQIQSDGVGFVKIDFFSWGARGLDASNTTKLVAVTDRDGNDVDNIRFGSGIVPELFAVAAVPEPSMATIIGGFFLLVLITRNRSFLWPPVFRISA